MFKKQTKNIGRFSFPDITVRYNIKGKELLQFISHPPSLVNELIFENNLLHSEPRSLPPVRIEKSCLDWL